MCAAAWSSCLRGTNFQWISGASLQLWAPEHWQKDLNEAAETHHKKKTDSFWLWQFLLFFYSFGVTQSGCKFVFVQQFLWILLQERFLLKWLSPHSKLLRSALDVESNSDWWASQLPIQPARQYTTEASMIIPQNAGVPSSSRGEQLLSTSTLRK